MPKLIIFDVYGTLLRADEGDNIARPGLREFLDFYKKQLKVTCSDSPLDILITDLKNAGIYSEFLDNYGEGNLIYENGIMKNLGRICEDAYVRASEAVFLGDNHSGLDERSAKHFKIKFVKVPQFRIRPASGTEKVLQKGYVKYDSQNRFSFASLIGKL